MTSRYKHILVFLIVFIVIGAPLYVIYSSYFRIYNFITSDVEVGSGRSPEENVDLISKECGSATSEHRSMYYCPCLLEKIYAGTSRIERVLYIYSNNGSLPYSMRNGARAIGLHRHDLERLFIVATSKIESYARECAANHS